MKMNRKLYFQKYYLKNKVNIIKKAKVWKSKNHEKIKQTLLKWRQKNPIYLQNKRLKERYNITVEEYNNLLKHQKSKCSICQKEETRILYGVISKLSVDHDHKTGKVRGLLCCRCNRTIGLVKEDVLILKYMIKYLMKARV
jgi:hypothetical protein